MDSQEALSTLTAAVLGKTDLASALRKRWRGGARVAEADKGAAELPADLHAAADLLRGALAPMTHNEEGIANLVSLLDDTAGEVIFSWAASSTARRDVYLADFLAAAAKHASYKDRVTAIARARVVEGPLYDALACAPLLGDGKALSQPDNTEACARLEILIWEAGASALEIPALGKWIWANPTTFEKMVRGPARGTLRGRVLAARCLEISVRGIPPTTDPELFGKTLQVLQPLVLHPEPLVWVHAARALGRLAGAMEQMEGTILDWALGESKLLRQRATTAFGSLPADRLKFFGSQMNDMLGTKEDVPGTLGALAAATPYLFFERREVWNKLTGRILAGDGGAIAARALARGLATIWRRGYQDAEVENPLRALRERARFARPDSLDESRRWIEVIAISDAVDGAERDPLDVELGIENLVRVAAQYDDEEADARAARFASSLVTTLNEARNVALGRGPLRQRAAAMNALEGAARAFALRLWGPLLATSPAGDRIEEPDLEETWKLIAGTPSEILDLVKERRATSTDLAADLPLEILAVRLGGYALDACGEDSDLGPGRGPTAHDTCLWLRKIQGLSEGTRELPEGLKNALSTLFWRLVDTTQGTALGEVDDLTWLGPFAAWWALVIDRPAMLLQLATALPMIEKTALEQCGERAEALRDAVSLGMADGEWGPSAAEALGSLKAQDTELAQSLAGLAKALESFAAAAGHKPELEALSTELVLAADRLHSALANPVKALHAPTGASPSDDSLARKETENAPRIAGLVARAIRAREISMLDVWLASLGPVTSALLEDAVKGAIGRTRPPPPAPKKKEPKLIAGYELVQPLGEGGIGSVYLVRKPGADRFFVLKIPKAEALAQANDTEREGILASFVEEAKALAGLYHPNVANIIDRGVSDDVPFLVLEYLIGADLKQYAGARPMTLFELKNVVAESCAGLAALHGAGLVHRDIKPANIWLRLPLAGGEKFDGPKHRDPARAQPLTTVVIDFGMVRAIRVPQDAAGRFVAGTAGYIAPEQVLDPIELDPRSDVYALAGTVYNVTTGRSFFDDIENPRDRIMAHMRQNPFEDEERLRAYPKALARLLRAATAASPKDRPSPIEFGREFGQAL